MIANAIHVSTTGSDSGNGSGSNPYRTIAHAATVAGPGDTVLVSAGTYVEQNIAPAASGTENAMIVFKPDLGSGEVTLRHPATSTSTTPIFSLSNRSFIWIEGFLFEGFAHGQASIVISSGGDNVVFGNRFENLGNQGEESWNCNSVVWVYQSVRNTVRNNYFENIYGDGVSLNGQGTSNNLVTENTFIDFIGKYRSWGGEYLYSRAIDIQDSTDGHNVVAFNYGRGLKNHIWLDRDGSHNVMLRNVAHDSDGIVFNESRCAFNLIQENIGYDLGVGYQTARYASTGRTSDARWINNVAFNNGTGFYVHMSDRDEFRNNIVFNNSDYNIVFTSDAQSSGPHIFRNNLWYTEGNSNSIQLGGSAVSVSQFQSSVGETGGLSADPLFVSPSSLEGFALQDSSPAGRAGDGGVDMGAFAVYPPTAVGWDSSLELGNVQVQFESVISEASRGQQVQLVLSLNQATQDRVTVDVVPVGGDAQRDSDFVIEGQTVTFEPGETSRNVTISVVGSSGYDELIAFGLAHATCAQPGARNLRLLRIHAG